MAKRKVESETEAKPRAAEGIPPAEGTYTVLAGRYRPQLFEELVGQEPVAEALVNALESGRVAHAYLFTGARGVGKTSTARILAKCLNCVKGPTAHPCNVCDSCLAVAQGEDVDVIEIDGASNNKVDEVRELRGNVQFRPSRGNYKIYIIDEVHMLTPGAFNALLKTLEEPPPHVKFIFATTEVQKIPVTILSRCQRFDFAGIGTPRIVERLRQIVATEKMEADDEALELIARRAGGSMRDAQSLLDQLLAFATERLTIDQIHRLLGLASDERIGALAAAVLEGDASKALELIAQAADQGMQVGEFLDQLIAYWRDLMVVNCGGLEGKTLSVRTSLRESLAQQAKRCSLDGILAGLDLLTTAKARARTTNHPRLLLEMALVRLARLDQLVSVAQLAQWLSQSPEARAATAPASRPAAAAPSGNRSPGLAARFSAGDEAVKKNALTPRDPIDKPATLALTAETLPPVWDKVLAQAGMALGMVLRKAGSQAIFGPNSLAIRFPAIYNQERQQCQDGTNIARIEELLRAITGEAWTIRVEQDEAAGGASGEIPGGTEQEPAHVKLRRQRTDALNTPLLKRVVEVLDAQVLELPEGFGAAMERSAKPDEES